MQINITRFFNEACPKDYSASIAEIGNKAGQYTYQAALDDADEYNMLDTEEAREAFKADVAEYGAWDREEIAVWSVKELNALFIQIVSGEMREHNMSPENNNEQFWDQYYYGGNAGRITNSDTTGEVYYDLS